MKRLPTINLRGKARSNVCRLKAALLSRKRGTCFLFEEAGTCRIVWKARMDHALLTWEGTDDSKPNRRIDVLTRSRSQLGIWTPEDARRLRILAVSQSRHLLHADPGMPASTARLVTKIRRACGWLSAPGCRYQQRMANFEMLYLSECAA